MWDQIQEGRCNMRTYITTIIILLLITNCSQKTVPLKTTDAQSYFVLELEKADLYFNKEIVLNKAYDKIQDETLQSRKEELITTYKRLKSNNFDKLRIPMKIDSNSTKEEVENYLLLSLVYYDLLKEGKAKVYNKLSNEFESRITYKKLKTKLGDEGVAFYFDDGTEFYYQVLAVGE